MHHSVKMVLSHWRPTPPPTASPALIMVENTGQIKSIDV